MLCDMPLSPTEPVCNPLPLSLTRRPIIPDVCKGVYPSCRNRFQAWMKLLFLKSTGISRRHLAQVDDAMLADLLHRARLHFLDAGRHRAYHFRISLRIILITISIKINASLILTKLLNVSLVLILRKGE